jgi:hypothetical protein
LIAQNVEGIRMQLIGAVCHVVGYGTLPQPISRIEGRTLNTELVHHFIGRIDVGLNPRVLNECHWDAVELNFIFESETTIDVVAAGIPLHARRKIHK